MRGQFGRLYWRGANVSVRLGGPRAISKDRIGQWHTLGGPLIQLVRLSSQLHTSADVLRIGEKWRALWGAEPSRALPYAGPTGSKRYILSMFPYPSGTLHMGHVRVYTISDALSRYARLRGHRVLHPMGWDAFGLPAENAAIERDIPPDQWTRQNVIQMRHQLDALCFLFDWDREVTTCEPDYYQWTQWIFLQLYRAGLAYRQEGLVNWDPVDQTVLADEQVDPMGRSWRSGALVERRPLTQWYLRITAYQDELLRGLSTLGEWPEAVKDMQRHWIIGDDKSGHRLRDWLISRQRYWGTPIPIIHCPSCGTVPVPEDQLPVQLPKNVQITGRGGSPLGKLESWLRVACPTCGDQGARREADTMDTFMDSSWYYWRYCAPRAPLDDLATVRMTQEMLPVDVYVGGIEHAILHLLYARFIHKFLSERLGVRRRKGEERLLDLGSSSSSSSCSSSFDEPFAQLITQGLVEGLTYQCPRTKRYLRPEEVSSDPQTGRVLVRATGEEPITSWTKMSKSKYNGVDPTALVSIHGADVLRLCILFKAPPEITLKWSTRDIAGPQRWLVRLLNLAERIAQSSDGKAKVVNANLNDTNDGIDGDDDHHLIQFKSLLHKSIQSMEAAFEVRGGQSKLNLAVSNLMKLSNEIERSMGQVDGSVLRDAMCILAIMLHPLAPCTSAELLSILDHNAPLSWPQSAGPIKSQ